MARLNVMPVDLSMLDDICGRAAPEAIEVRRTIHREPELSWQERRTQSLLIERLSKLGLEPVRVAGTGLYVDIGEGERMVLYRADMDALPIQDAKSAVDSPVISSVAGVSHACGHDLHTAVAYGLAHVLSQTGAPLPGRVRILFQPAEEVIPSGAEACLQAGVASGALAAFALHADPAELTGRIGVRSGPLTACGDAFHIEVTGRGGHSSRLYLARDPILAAARVVEALNTLVSQRVDPLKPVVLAVGMIHGGSAPNVIADVVQISGTLRTFDEDIRRFLHEAIASTASAAAATQGCSVKVRIDEGAPSLRNDPTLDALVRECAKAALGEDCLHPIEHPSTAGEDFSYFGTKAPIYLVRLGVRHPKRQVRHLHTAEFDPDEAAIEVALRVMSRVLFSALDQLEPSRAASAP